VPSRNLLAEWCHAEATSFNNSSRLLPGDVECGAPTSSGTLQRKSIILIIDYSSSINAYFETSIKAAQRLVVQLSPTDTISVISDDVKLLSGPTTDKKKTIEALEYLRVKFRDHEQGKESLAVPGSPAALAMNL
jgi:hypothetical protein